MQRLFIRQIRRLRDLDYKDSLRELGLYSQQQSGDNYQPIYMWKIMEKLVLNPTPSALHPYTSERTGC